MPCPSEVETETVVLKSSGNRENGEVPETTPRPRDLPGRGGLVARTVLASCWHLSSGPGLRVRRPLPARQPVRLARFSDRHRHRHRHRGRAGSWDLRVEPKRQGLRTPRGSWRHPHSRTGVRMAPPPGAEASQLGHVAALVAFAGCVLGSSCRCKG